MTSKTPRTGNQYSIHYGDYSAVICELGAKIRRFDYQGKEIFCPFGVNDLTPTCNGYVLAPWPNRIENGEYDFNGKHYCAPVNEYHPAPRNNANHGYAYHYMWKLESLTDSAVTLSLRFPNLDGYPFDVTVTVTVTGGRVTGVEIDASGETPELGGIAAETLADQLTKAGSTSGVDAVAGATMTSDAVFTAMDDCLSQAE